MFLSVLSNAELIVIDCSAARSIRCTDPSSAHPFRVLRSEGYSDHTSDIGQRHFDNKIAVRYIWKRLKRIVPKGVRRQRHFIWAFPNGIKRRVRINLDLFTRQNENLTARNGCTADKFKARPFRNHLRQSERSERRACGREIGNGIGRFGRKDNFLCIRNIIGIYRRRFQYSSPCSAR